MRIGLPLLLSFAIVSASCEKKAANRAPRAAQESPAEAYRSDVEDAVLELESSLADLARQVRRQAAEGAVRFFSKEFRGSPLLALPPGGAKVERVGAVTVTTWKDSVAPSGGIAESLRRFFGEISAVEHAVFKIPKAEGTASRLKGVMKLDLVAFRGRGRIHVTELYDAEWRKVGAGWKIARLARTGGRHVRSERNLFADVTGSVGLSLPVRVERPDLPVYMEPYSFLGGIAAGDYDGDGDLDLYVPRVGPNRLYRNEGGKFVEVARETNTRDEDAGAAALFVDLDNDGRLDLLVTNLEAKEVPTRSGLRRNDKGKAIAYFRNKGDGTFEDRTDRAGLRTQGPAMSVVAADVDGDGDLDFYVCMYKDFRGDAASGMIPVPDDILHASNGVANQLWINQGDGTFREEAKRRGVADSGWSFAAGFADFDDDGRPDLYVANDYGPNRLYRNRGDGTFEDVTAKLGVGDTGFGMGVGWGDADGDGRLDLYVSNMYSTAGNRVLGRGRGGLSPEAYRTLRKMARGNTLLRNLGGAFRDTTASSGTGGAGWAWSNAFFDYDSDGRPDLYVANGYMTGESEVDT